MQYLPYDILSEELATYLSLEDLFRIRAINVEFRQIYHQELERREDLLERALALDNIAMLLDILLALDRRNPENTVIGRDFHDSRDLYRDLIRKALHHNSVRTLEWLFKQVPASYLQIEYRNNTIDKIPQPAF